MNLTGNIVTTFSSRLGVAALSFLSSILLARFLGPEGRGIFALVNLIPEMILTFGLLGFDQAYAVYAGLEPEKRRAMLWQSISMAGVIGGAGAILGYIYLVFGAPGSEKLIKGPLWLYILPLSVVPASMITRYWLSILRGMNRILLLNAIEFGAKLASIVVVLTLVGWLDLDVAGAVYGGVALSIGQVILLIVLFRSLKVLGRPSFDAPFWRRTGTFALPTYFGSIMGYLNYRIDQFLIAFLLPPKQLAFYVLAVGLAEQLWVLSGAVSAALLPHLTNRTERDPAVSAVIGRHVMVLTGIACLVLFVFADLLVPALYTNAFGDAVAPLRWLLPGIFTLSIGKVLVSEILAREKAKWTMWIAAVAVTINIVGNLILIPLMGISGAAFASSLSYTSISILVIWVYVRETAVPVSMLLPRYSDLLSYSYIWRRLTERWALGNTRN
jgi:O-antigen/teichoic acid export membrane protein